MCGAGLARLARGRLQQRLGILMYHGVEADALPMPCWHVIGKGSFLRQMLYLREHFSVLPLQEALERMQDGTLPERAVTLTFDDGTRNLADCVAPVLRDLQMPGAIFLTTGPMDTGDVLWPDRLWQAFADADPGVVDLTVLGIGPVELRSAEDRALAYQEVVTRCKDLPDAKRIRVVDSLIEGLGTGDTGAGPFAMLSWQQARSMTRDAGITLHPHSVTHPILSRCGDAKLQYEIAESCAVLERQTGSASEIFAYPNGRAQDFDERAKSVLRDCGIRWALASTHGFADRECDPLALPRLAIGADMSYARFRLLVSGVFHHRRSIGPRTDREDQCAIDVGSGATQRD